ncbi:MAG: NUDIX hydrolase [Chloroflexi bacterium]|nr:NUDIX hydrolase [Chloroflexota bacterium]
MYAGRVVTLILKDVAGSDGRRHRREIVEHVDAAAVVAVDAQERVLLVRQHRPAVGEDMVELPAGLVDAGETPAECALRELQEETGYTADSVDLLASYYSSAGFCTERVWVYLAVGLNAAGGTPHLDAGEELEVLWEPLDGLRERIRRAEIADAKTLVGLLAYLDRTSEARHAPAPDGPHST